ncbi:MAG: hypothetical protein M3Y33_14320 [Actinomycetota bacterium]|nr:hypothetical protein [Actinomycetota bacterium]
MERSEPLIRPSFLVLGGGLAERLALLPEEALVAGRVAGDLKLLGEDGRGAGVGGQPGSPSVMKRTQSEWMVSASACGASVPRRA